MTVTAPVPSASRVRKRSRRPILIAFVIVAALGFLIAKGLDNATMYFRTADEALAQRSALEGKRFRIEGTVVPGSIVTKGSDVDFMIASKTANVNVHNQGQPVGIFQDNIPVVLEGKFQTGSNVFDSDRILVKHSADYTAEHPDRVNGSANK
jgi:cytochrome c-type biogenesis protein CcmE